jgi:SecD/SecF fusion protein
MKNNLFARFGLIAGVLILIVGLSYPWKLKGGIDLVGGTDLLYELNLTDVKGDTTDLAKRIIETLKRRVDPTGVRNLVWRVVGGNRIEVQMPLADKETREARKAFADAQAALRASNLQMFQVTAAVDQTGPQRIAALDKLAAAGTPQRASLEKLAAAADARRAAEKTIAEYKDPALIPVSALDALADARAQYDAAFNEIKAYNIDVTEISDLMAAPADNAAAAAKLKSIIDLPQYASKKPLIESLKIANDVLAEHKGGGLDDPDELERLVRSSGVLDFRIALERTDSTMLPIIVQAHTDLATKGPYKAVTGASNVRWFEIDPENGTDLATQSNLVTDKWGGKSYILLYDDRAHALTHDPTREWKLTQARSSTDDEQREACAFSFDPSGQQYFGEMTAANVGRPMAICLDSKAISAPDIKVPITGGSGIITFGNKDPQTVHNEVDSLVKILDAGSLPATLQPDPISKKTIDSALGEDNIKAGLRSGILAVIAVMAFMVVYYTITGFFADVALLINLILLLGSMAMLQATFTLPGIAGIVLTLGMAVDANVLINERIREELHKGASLWNAVKQGYDKVFWTIFDANTTTSLTSIVLIYVASEEVKGFGVTLLIGLIIHMFTALFVTRTLMIAAIRWGIFKAIDDLSIAEYFRDIFTFTWLRGRWPFMRVFHLANFDWIGKRHIFWGISAVITVAGLASFIVRNNDKSAYDTEFNGGTDVSFTLKPGKDLDTAEVRARVYAIPDDPKLTADEREKLRDLKQANVYSVKSENATAKQFEIVTTIADRSTPGPDGKNIVDKRKDLLLNELLNAFKDVLDEIRPLQFGGSDLDAKDIHTLMENRWVVPITKPALTPDQIGGSSAIDASAYQGGVAIVLDLKEATSLDALKKRISDTRHGEDFKMAVDRMSDVVAVTYAPGADGAKGFVKTAVLLVSDPNITYDKAPARWQAELAGNEWTLVKTAMNKRGGFQGVTSFDPQVADAAKAQAIVAVGLSLILIVIYVWIRFGGIRYGLGAIFSLVHDAIVAIAATVLAGVFQHHFPKIADALLIGDFKINLTMIAAYLTVIGYSVNDTIVIFDRIRENRGRDTTRPLSSKLINDSINQCFGRTIWTTFTVFIVVLIMYIWGGEGVRGFSFAMLVGVFTGAYSTLAIASPMLLNVKEKAPTGQPTKPGSSLAVIPEIGVRPSGLSPQR